MYIEDLTKITVDTILSDNLFEEIYLIDDDFEKAKILLSIEEKAKMLGKKVEFEKLLRAYIKQKKKSDSDSKVVVYNQNNNNTGMTEFHGGNYQDFRSGIWVANENGIRTYTMLGEKEACSHPIMPVQILTNAETGFCKVKIAFKLKGKWKEIVVDKEVVSSSSKIVSLAKFGIRVTSENSKTLVQYMSDMESMNEDYIVEQVSTSKLGWINNEFMPYGENIVFDNEQSFKTVFESIRECGSREVWYNLVKSIRKDNKSESKFFIVGSLASPIIELVNGLPFILDMYGTTGKGKTVSLMLATSIWANPSDNEYITDPKTTPTALEFRLDFLNNLPIMIDDMAQLKNKYDGDFSELVYFLCSGKGKDRANQNLGINKSTTWKNVMLVNSEHSMVTETMQGGAVNRIIDIETGEGYIFNNGNEVVNIINENYGFCGKEFIDLLHEIGFDEVKKMQKEYVKKITDAARKLGVEKEEKQIIPMSILLTTDFLATNYLFKDEIFLDFDYCVDLLKNKGEVSENERAYEFIMSEVSINMNKFRPDSRGEYKGEIWGCIEKDYVIIMNNTFNAIAKKGNFSSISFLSWAGKLGLIQCDKNGKSTKPKRLDGSLSRCIFLKIPSDSEQTILNHCEEFMVFDENEQEKLPFD